MAPCHEAVAPSELSSHAPCFDSEADAIMESLRGLSASELASRIKISISMAQNLLRMAYDFPYKASGDVAIKAFTGVVFKAFEYATLSDAEKRRTDESVGIISSLYGFLKPSDIIKPYRLDYTTPLAPGNVSFCSYWKNAVTDKLIENLAAGHHTEILDLLPGDAAKCIDWKRLAQHARRLKADFRTVTPGGGYKTPSANRLKTLRGRLLRQIIQDNITTFGQLDISSEDYMTEGIEGSSLVLATEK